MKKYSMIHIVNPSFLTFDLLKDSLSQNKCVVTIIIYRMHIIHTTRRYTIHKGYIAQNSLRNLLWCYTKEKLQLLK